MNHFGRNIAEYKADPERFIERYPQRTKQTMDDLYAMLEARDATIKELEDQLVLK